MWWLVAGCTTTDGDPTDAPSTDATTPNPASLHVDGGFGGGDLAVDGKLHVWAEVDPSRAIVTGWTGDTRWLESPAEWNGDARPPTTDATVAPVVLPVDAPVLQRQLTLPTGDRRLLWLQGPVDPVGVVLFFHGAAYAVDQLNDVAARSVALHLVHAGYRVVALPSEAEASAGTGGWSAVDEAQNPDLVAVGAMVEALRGDGTIPPGAPLFAWGMSSGGQFAHLVGARLPTVGVASFCAPGADTVVPDTDAATAWYLAERDGTFGDAASQAASFEAALRGRGVPTDLYVHPATPLYDQRFERVGLDPVRSAALADGVRAAGWVDELDRWIVTGAVASAGLASLPAAAGLDDPQRTAVAAELEIMAADHELYDDTAARAVAFFDLARTR